MNHKTTLSLLGCILLTACAANTGAPALEARLASWNGAPADQLIAVLGNPTYASETELVWREQLTGLASAPSAASLSSPANDRLMISSVGRPTSSGIEQKSWTETGESRVSPRDCVYMAKLDGDKVVGIIADSVSGRCRFDELPLRSAS